jgi:hypothetical protein
MARVACTLLTRILQDDGVLCSHVPRTGSYLEDLWEGLIYVGLGLAYVVVRNPQLGYNRFESSLLLGYGDSIL